MTLSDIYSDSLFGILFDILFGILSDILFGIFGIYSGILYGSIWHMFGSMRFQLPPALVIWSSGPGVTAVRAGDGAE